MHQPLLEAVDKADNWPIGTFRIEAGTDPLTHYLIVTSPFTDAEAGGILHIHLGVFALLPFALVCFSIIAQHSVLLRLLVSIKVPSVAGASPNSHRDVQSSRPREECHRLRTCACASFIMTYWC